jgi:hypothetical protein
MQSFLLPTDAPSETATTQPSPPKKRGRPTFKPTKEERERVLHMGKMGIRHQQIATAFGVDTKTLRKHFRRELANAAAQANLVVVEKIYELATGGNLTAAIFWAKSRCDFRTSGPTLDETAPSPSETNPLLPTPPTIITVYNNDGEPNADC